jgi:Xaa-Pro aminopeptidase
MRCADVDAAARSVISEAGYGDAFNHGLGHGVGLEVHEAPRLGPNSQETLRPGMVVTIEPGIYLPGRAGVRIEEMALITETGHQVLSTMPRRPAQLPAGPPA